VISARPYDHGRWTRPSISTASGTTSSTRCSATGVYERLDDGTVATRWHPDVAVRGVVAAAARPEPAEAAVGYALAAPFGTGARFFLVALFVGLGENAPRRDRRR
jgi:hypothetical protein